MISIAFSLLLAASSLILQVQNSPNVSDALRLQAYSIATQAISYAEETLALNGATIDTTATTTDAVSLPTILSTPTQTPEATVTPVVTPVAQAPVVEPPAPVIPAPPTCTLSHEAIQSHYYADGSFAYYFTYLDWVMTGNKITATINGKSTTQVGIQNLKGGENDFHMVVTDNYGQSGTCDDSVVTAL